MSEEKKAMTWQEKHDAARRIMELLDSIDVKVGNREQELSDVMEIVLKLLLPCQSVRLVR